MTPTEEIKSRLDIVDLLRQYMTLLPAGKNFKAVCPFHKEKTPSFIVSPERQTWHCFGACGEGGDIFKFIMKHENLEFYEALRILAEKAGIELRKTSPADYRQFGVLYDLNEAAKEFFASSFSETSFQYLAERGLKKETIKDFEIGFAPHASESLTLHLVHRKFDISDAERAGLVLKSRDGRYFDRFRGRIMFPIMDSFGKTVGFSGRIMPEFDDGKSGKYINSPETPVFNKSRILYGLHKSKSHIRETDSAILMEGQMDFLMSWQDGLQNIAATSGTALTQDHLATLRRLCGKLTLCFDNDEAGIKAADRAMALAVQEDFSVKVLTIKDADGKDPADIVRAHPGKMKDLAVKASPAMHYFFETMLTEFSDRGAQSEKAGEFKKAVRACLERIGLMASPIDRALWVRELAERTRLPERGLAEEIERMNRGKNSPVSPSAAGSESKQLLKRIEIIAERLLSLGIYDRKYLDRLEDAFEFLPIPAQKAYLAASGKEEVKDMNLVEAMNFLSLRSSFEVSVLGEANVEKEFEELKSELRREYRHSERTGTIEMIRKAEQNGDSELLEKLLREFDAASRFVEK